MAMFGKLFARHRSALVTCIVRREGDSWQGIWPSDGREPPDFSAESLTAAAELATAQIPALCATQPDAAPAALQLAIYPWADSTAGVILDITSDADGLTARDIEGSGVLVRGDTLEVLVSEAEQTVPNPRDAMFRWVRPISSLHLS